MVEYHIISTSTIALDIFERNSRSFWATDNKNPVGLVTLATTVVEYQKWLIYSPPAVGNNGEQRYIEVEKWATKGKNNTWKLKINRHVLPCGACCCPYGVCAGVVRAVRTVVPERTPPGCGDSLVAVRVSGEGVLRGFGGFPTQKVGALVGVIFFLYDMMYHMIQNDILIFFFFPAFLLSKYSKSTYSRCFSVGPMEVETCADVLFIAKQHSRK